MKKLLYIIMILATVLNAKSINVAVAANVSYAMDELIDEFNKENPNIKVEVTLGSSGKLSAQISHGAPYELFLSANMKYPEALFKNKIAITKPLVYARGSLAMFSAKELNFNRGIEVVMQKEIEHIAIANPKTAPYGKATVEALKRAGLFEKVKYKFVYAESISQTVAYSVNATDLGFIAKSSLYSPKMQHFKEKKNWIEVSPTLYTPIKQGIVLLKGSTKEAKDFYDFMLSSKAKEILKRYGYITDEI
jgi:molybdate transport system substrate-binding protein